jgi:hypothetical protein
VQQQRSAQVTERVIAQAGPEQLPWLKDDQLQAQATKSNKAAQPKRPEGMMSIGGPKLAKAELPDSVLSVTPDAGPRPIDPSMDPSLVEDAAASDDAKKIRPPVNSSQQGFTGTKSGPAAIRGRPGSKSGVTVRGLSGTKSGAAAQRYTVVPPRAYRPRAIAKRHAPKPKYYYFAANSGPKYKKSKTFKPHYNMMQALSGSFY